MIFEHLYPVGDEMDLPRPCLPCSFSPFTGEFCAATWNAHALFTVHVIRMNSKLHVIRHLLGIVDFLGVQESHDDGHKSAIILHAINNGFFVVTSFNSDNNNLGGTLLIIKNKYKVSLPTHIHVVIIPGRLHYFAMSSDSHGILLVNFHVDPGMDPDNIIALLNEIIKMRQIPQVPHCSHGRPQSGH